VPVQKEVWILERFSWSIFVHPGWVPILTVYVPLVFKLCQLLRIHIDIPEIPDLPGLERPVCLAMVMKKGQAEWHFPFDFPLNCARG
jgi:hypothetical protein